MKKQEKEIGFSRFGKGVFPAKASFLLDNPLRKLIKSPKLVADRLSLQSQYHVLEVGAGGGYYSVEVASRLTAGQLTILDIQPNMLDKAMSKLREKGFDSVTAVLADACVLPLRDAQFDRVFMVTVLGEVPDPCKTLQETFRVLRPGGLLSVGEQRTDPDFLSLSFVKSLADNVGFEFVKSFGYRWNYTANFMKPGND